MKSILNFYKRSMEIMVNLFAEPDLLGSILDNSSPEIISKCCLGSPQYQKSKIYSLFSYQDPLVKRMIVGVKDEKRLGLIDTLGKLLFDLSISALSEFSESGYKTNHQIIIAPVPISKRRHLMRGYSQTKLLAKAIFENSDHKNFEYSPNLIIRTRKSNPQTSLISRGARLVNVKNLFKINGDCRKRIVIVVDDVTTTGATLMECHRILKKAGAKIIILIAVAG